jgi:hypothetical protein
MSSASFANPRGRGIPKIKGSISGDWHWGQIIFLLFSGFMVSLKGQFLELTSPTPRPTSLSLHEFGVGLFIFLVFLFGVEMWKRGAILPGKV